MQVPPAAACFEQSWRWGERAARIAALEAFSRRPGVFALRAECTEVLPTRALMSLRARFIPWGRPESRSSQVPDTRAACLRVTTNSSCRRRPSYLGHVVSPARPCRCPFVHGWRQPSAVPRRRGRSRRSLYGLTSIARPFKHRRAAVTVSRQDNLEDVYVLRRWLPIRCLCNRDGCRLSSYGGYLAAILTSMPRSCGAPRSRAVQGRGWECQE